MVQQKGQIVHRFTIFIVFFACLFGIIGIRLWFMQVVSGNKYDIMAEGNRIREVTIKASRGIIIDRNEEKLVLNRKALSVFVNPKEFNMLEDKDAAKNEIAILLEIDRDNLEKKLKLENLPKHTPVMIAQDVEPDKWFYIAERQKDYEWLRADYVPVREYPEEQETLAAHVLGYLGEISEKLLEESSYSDYRLGDIIGTSGVEAFYETELKGQDGYQKIEVNAQGIPLEVIEEKEPTPGNTLLLTLDSGIQKAAEVSLQEAMQMSRMQFNRETGENYKATAGAVVVLEPKTGEILAMASEPTFSLEKFVGGIDEEEWNFLIDPENNYPLNNRAIVGEYPPGSVFKVVTALAGLAEGFATEHSVYSCSGVYSEGEFENFPKRCWATHGKIDFATGMKESCDIVYYDLGYQFYKKWQSGTDPSWETRLQDYARAFNLGQVTGVDLPFEHAGRIPTPKWKKEFNQGFPEYQRWYPGDSANIAVGQGDILANPLQIASLYAALANRGPYYIPHVGKEVWDWQGNVLRTIEPVQAGDASSSEQGLSVPKQEFESVHSMLCGVVTGKGTAAATFADFPILEIPVAGKTGTSEIAGKQTCAWFACYAPADDPQYVIVVTIEEGGHGGAVAAPVAKRILEHIYGLPQTPLTPSSGD